ncbi:MAG TPA: response regulator transcription factor [Lysobacter sp.]
MSLRILTVDDHPLIRMGIRALIEAQADMELVGEAVGAASGLALYEQLRPDVTLLDLQMPDMNGLDALERMHAAWPEGKVLILTTYRGDVNARRAFTKGASGYLLKSTLGTELADAIRTVAAGKRSISPDVAMDLAVHAGGEALTGRELAILHSAAAGHENKKIASHLGISTETVKSHLRHIFGKLGARNRTDALRIATDRGLLPP